MKPEKTAVEHGKNHPSTAGHWKLNLDGYWLSMVNALRAGTDKKNWPPLVFEIFLAVSMCVAYYFLVQIYAVGTPNNSTNLWVFSSCSLSNFHLDQLYDCWKGRLSGLLVSGYLFDSAVQNNSLNMPEYNAVFGLYQSLWLFLLFLVVIFALRFSLLINLGIFAGLIYDFSPASGMYLYPWDIPSTVFFTLGVLLFERRQILLMILVTCVGCFFKETVLVCALLLLFVEHWKWWKRFLIFGAVVAVYVVGKKILFAHLHLKVAALSMSDANSLFDPSLLVENIKFSFTPTINQVVFSSAGTMVALLALGWRRRYLPYMLLVVVFIAGQLMYGVFHEFRIFMQILPLSLMILAEWWREYTWPAAVSQPQPTSKPTSEKADTGKKSLNPTVAAPLWSLRETFPILALMTILLAVASVAIPAWRYNSVVEYRAQAMESLTSSAQSGYGPAQLALGKIYRDGLGLKADDIEAYKWLKLAQLQGVPEADKELTNCATAMTTEQINAAEDEVKQFQTPR
jgi:hypothetical protein